MSFLGFGKKAAALQLSWSKLSLIIWNNYTALEKGMIWTWGKEGGRGGGGGCY